MCSGFRGVPILAGISRIESSRGLSNARYTSKTKTGSMPSILARSSETLLWHWLWTLPLATQHGRDCPIDVSRN